MKIEILTEFFGAVHLEMLFRTLVPSLWQQGNIPAMLREGHSVVHRIYCPPNEARSLSPYAMCSKIPVEINTAIVTQDMRQARDEGLYRAFQDHLRRETLTVMAPCDHVFGVGLWQAIGGLIPGQYLVCGHPRIDYENGFGVVEDFLATRCEDPNYNFVHLCMEKVPHPMVEHGKRYPENYWRTARRENHWETFFAEPPPLAFWSSPDMLEPWTKKVLHGPWEVIDHDLVDHCHRRGTLRSVTDSREFFWTEFTSNRMYVPTLYTRLELDAMKHFNRTPNHWFYRG